MAQILDVVPNDKKKKKLVTPKLIAPKIVLPKYEPLKALNLPLQKLQAVVKKIDKAEATKKFLPITYEDSIDVNTGAPTKVPVAKKVFDAITIKPPAKYAEKLLNYVKQDPINKYRELNEGDRKVFWSYAISKGLLNDNVSDEMKAEREKYAGSEFFSSDKLVTEANKNQTARIKAETEAIQKTAPKLTIPMRSPALPSRTLTKEQKNQTETNLKNQIKSVENELALMKKPTPVINLQDKSTIPTNAPNPQLANKLTELSKLNQQLAQFKKTGVLSEADFSYTPVENFVSGLETSATLGMNKSMASPGMREKIEGAQKTLPGFIGSIAGYIPSTLFGEVGLAKAGIQGATTLGKIGAGIIRSAIVGSAQAGVQGVNEGQTAEEIAKNIGLNIALAGATEIGGAGISKVVKSATESVMARAGKKLTDIPTSAEAEQIAQAVENHPEVKKVLTKFESGQFKVMDNGEIYKDGQLVRTSSKIGNDIQLTDTIQGNQMGNPLQRRIEAPVIPKKTKFGTINRFGKFPTKQVETIEPTNVKTKFGTLEGKLRLSQETNTPLTTIEKDINQLSNSAFSKKYGLDSMVDLKDVKGTNVKLTESLTLLSEDIGRKVSSELNTSNPEEIVSHYTNKYNLPKVSVVYDVPKKSKVFAIAETNPISGESIIHLKKVAPDNIKDTNIMLGSLRHEIEHVKDSYDGYTPRNAMGAKGKASAFEGKNLIDVYRSGQSGHHKNYGWFEYDYLRKSAVKKMLKNGETIPDEIMKDFPELQKVDVSKYKDAKTWEKPLSVHLQERSYGTIENNTKGHAIAVKKAFERGDYIPPEVLKDYPQFKAKETIADVPKKTKFGTLEGKLKLNTPEKVQPKPIFKSNSEELLSKANDLEREANKLYELNKKSPEVFGQPIQKGQDYTIKQRNNEAKRQGLLKEAEKLRQQAKNSINREAMSTDKGVIERRIKRINSDLKKMRWVDEYKKDPIQSVKYKTDIAQAETRINTLKQQLADANEVINQPPTIAPKPLKPIGGVETPTKSDAIPTQLNKIPDSKQNVYLHSTKAEFDKFNPAGDGFVYLSKKEGDKITQAERYFNRNQVMDDNAPKNRLIKASLDDKNLKLFDPFKDKKAAAIMEKYGLDPRFGTVKWDDLTTISKDMRDEGYSLVEVREPDGGTSWAVSNMDAINIVGETRFNQPYKDLQPDITQPKPLARKPLQPKPLNYPKGERTNVNKLTLSEAYALRKNQPPAIAPKPLKPLSNVKTPPTAENLPRANVQPITNIDEAIKYTKSKISTSPLTKQKPLFQKASDAYQEVFSTNLPFEKIGKLKVPGAKSLSQQAQNVAQVSGTVDHIFEKDLVGLEGTSLGKGLNDSIKGLSKSEQVDLWDMMLNKHNVDRMAQGKPVFGDEITSEMSDSIVKKYEANPKLKEAEQNVRKIIDTVTDEFAVKTGLVSKKTIDNIRQNIYKAYIPTYREMDQEAIQLVKMAGGKILKTATGSSKNLLPPEQQVAAYINKVVRAGRKNEMYNNLFDLVQANPKELESFAKLSQTTEARMKPNTGDVLSDAIDGLDNNAVKISSPMGNKYQFTLYKNGEPMTLDVSEQMYKALNSAVDDSAIAKVGDAFRQYATGPMKALITGYNPLFAITNFMRDIPTALLYSNNSARWIKNYPNAIKEIATSGDLWKQYQALGGTRSGLFSYEKGVTLPANRNVAQNVAKGTVDAVGAVGNITEVLPRFTEYLATIEKMGNNLEGRIAGMYNASEITTNFARSGKLTKQLDAFIPYLNPAVQGIDKFFRTVKNRPIQTIAKGVGLMTLPAMILESINSKDPAFKEINQRTKDSSYLIPMGEGKYFKVPKSRENALVFATLFEWLARSMSGEKLDVQQSLNTLATNFSPGDPVNSFVGTPLLKAFAQIRDPKAAIKNYANMDIVPQTLRGVDPKYQYDLTTRQASKLVGEKLNVSPKVIDYLIDSYTGVIGQATRPSTTKTGVTSTLGNKFIVDAVTQNDNVNKLYDLSDKLTTIANTKNLVGKIDSKVLTQEEARKNLINRQIALISKLRKSQKAVELENISMEEKKKKMRDIQINMNNIASETLKKFKP